MQQQANLGIDPALVEVPMPHFHFDVCTNGVTVEDEDGLDLLDAEFARLEAARAAAEMLQNGRRCRARRHFFVVRDGSAEPVCTVHVALKIQ
jgi:hypothetical protein